MGIWSKITSHCLQSSIGQLSLLLVPNMVLSNMNNHERRTEQTCESYTFQLLMSFWYQSKLPMPPTLPHPSPSPPPSKKNFPVCSLGSLDGQMSHWIASKSVKFLTHQWQCKSFPMRSNNRLFKCKYSETWLSAHLQDLPKGPLIKGCSLDRGLWKSHNVC